MNQTESSHHLHLPAGLRFAFVEAAWHADIVHQARDAFFAEMAQAGFGAEAIEWGGDVSVGQSLAALMPVLEGDES